MNKVLIFRVLLVQENLIFDFGAQIETVIEAKLSISNVTLAQELGGLDSTIRER